MEAIALYRNVGVACEAARFTLTHVSAILTSDNDFPQFVQINLATISLFLVL